MSATSSPVSISETRLSYFSCPSTPRSSRGFRAALCRMSRILSAVEANVVRSCLDWIMCCRRGVWLRLAMGRISR